MKKIASAILCSFVLVALSGLILTTQANSKPCHTTTTCNCCVEHKQNCCKDYKYTNCCCKNNCDDCATCKTCNDKCSTKDTECCKNCN